jgi:hypothetical protein
METTRGALFDWDYSRNQRTYTLRFCTNEDHRRHPTLESAAVRTTPEGWAVDLVVVTSVNFRRTLTPRTLGPFRTARAAREAVEARLNG